MISLRNRFLFVHIPKTAGNSIQSVLCDYSEDRIVTRGGQDGVERFEVRSAGRELEKHSTLADYYRELGEETAAGLFKFTCVRNPWDRMISFWFSPHRRETDHYETQHASWIATLPVGDLAARDCALFLWVIDSHLDAAMHVGRAWGFTYKTVAFAWVKADQRNAPRLNLGHWTRANMELVLLYTLGHPERHSKGVAQIVETVEPPVVRSRPGRHSEKPDEVQHRIKALMGDVPRLECFARRRLAGWVCVGNELDGLDITESLHRVATDAPLPRVEAAQAGLFEEIL
jgi:N6-adenosine-specific RNA methylase IME4